MLGSLDLKSPGRHSSLEMLPRDILDSWLCDGSFLLRLIQFICSSRAALAQTREKNAAVSIEINAT
jgi:hypothetical protein